MPDPHPTAGQGTDAPSEDGANPAEPPRQADGADAAAEHFAQGVALAGRGRSLDAARHFQQADRLRPDHTETLTNLGLLLSQFGQHDAALACINRAIALRPSDAAAALALAVALYRRGDVLAAIPAHRRAVALAPGNPIAWTALGDCLLAAGQTDDAITSFRKALALDPDQLAARRSLAACGLPDPQAHDIERLAARLDHADLPTEDRITAGFALGQILDTEDRYDEAFVRFAAANALVRETRAAAGHRFDPAAFDAAIDALIAQVTPDFLARAESGQSVDAAGVHHRHAAIRLKPGGADRGQPQPGVRGRREQSARTGDRGAGAGICAATAD